MYIDKYKVLKIFHSKIRQHRVENNCLDKTFAGQMTHLSLQLLT